MFDVIIGKLMKNGGGQRCRRGRGHCRHRSGGAPGRRRRLYLLHRDPHHAARVSTDAYAAHHAAPFRSCVAAGA